MWQENIMSKSFVFLETYRAAGNYWELKQKDNPLRVPPADSDLE